MLSNVESIDEGTRPDVINIKVTNLDIAIDATVEEPIKTANATLALKKIRGRKTYLEGERYVLRQKIHNPTVQHINDALEKFFKKAHIESKNTDMTEEKLTEQERDYEIRMKKQRRFW